MDAQSALEKKHDLLKSELDESLQKRHALELRINRQFEELKEFEVSLEKMGARTDVEVRSRH